MIFDICISPALYPFYKKDNDSVIVVDVFRASSSICAAFHNGAAAIIPVANIDEAQRYKTEGFLVGAERNARKCDFADFGNSPFDYSREKVFEKEIVFTTTNGTQAIDAAKDAANLFIGTFANIDVLVEKCAELNGRIVLICAGWNNKLNMEDTMFGGAFVEKLMEKRHVEFGSDAVKIALELWHLAKNNPLDYVKNTDHYHRLIANNVESDAAYCLQKNTVSVVPYFDKNTKKLNALHV